MTSDRFAVLRRGAIPRSQRRLADTIRLLIYRAAPGLFDALDFEDDRLFLDPLLFAWFTDTAPSLTLDQVLAEARAVEPVRGDWHVPGTAITVLGDRHPLFDRFFVDAAGNGVAVEVAGAVRAHRRHLAGAFGLLRTHCPDLWGELSAVVRRVLLYRGVQPNSFATLSAHGAIFLNVSGAIDEVFFLDDIAHQGGHVLFNALTLDKERFLRVDPATPLSVLGGGPGEGRTIYSAFHGLFTYTTIGRVLSACRERRVFEGRKAHEVSGRLGFILGKFKADLALLEQPELFTRMGWHCYRHFAGTYRDLHARHASLVDPFDYANQPYVFSYRHFAGRNPIPGRAGAALAGAIGRAARGS